MPSSREHQRWDFLGLSTAESHRASTLPCLLVIDACLPLLPLLWLWLCTVPLCSECFTIRWMAQFVGPSRVLRSYSRQNLRRMSTYDLFSYHRATTFFFCFTVNFIVERWSYKSQGTDTMITPPNPKKQNGISKNKEMAGSQSCINLFETPCIYNMRSRWQTTKYCYESGNHAHSTFRSQS